MLDQALAGFGGSHRVDSLRTLVVDSVSIRPAGDRKLEIRQKTFVQFPDRFRREVVLPGNTTLVSVIAPEESFIASPDGTAPMFEGQRVDVERTLARAPLSLLKGRRHETFSIVPAGEGNIDGHPVRYLHVLFAGDSSRIAVDRATGRILELRYVDRSFAEPEAAPPEVVIRYDDFREINALVYPFVAVAKRGDDPPVTTRVQSVQVDVELGPGLFRVPTK